MWRTRNWISFLLLAIAIWVSACGNEQKDAIQAAINAAQSAINVAKTEAEKYVPDQVDAAESALQSAKDALAKGDYSAALKAAQDATAKAKDLSSSATARKDELSKQWDDLNNSIPKGLNEVKAKLDAYSRGAHMPSGLDKTQLPDLKAEYDRLKQAWSDASGTAAQGNLKDAEQKASSLKDSLSKLMEKLGLKF